jgi:hypothetical protein
METMTSTCRLGAGLGRGRNGGRARWEVLVGGGRYERRRKGIGGQEEKGIGG